MNIHYLDNSATTQVCQEAADAAYRMMRENYGNPSSLHKVGIQAETAVEEARGIIADALNVQPKTIYFTSGGTEANNTALFGAAQALRRRGDRVIVSAVEHSSVYESAKRLGELGFDVQFAPVTDRGVVDIDALKALLTDKTILVSIMTVNNETGAVQPIEQIAKLVHKNCPEALFHSDAVQAFGKLPVKPKKWGVDLMSVSAHKIHGAKGCGALYIRDGARILPLLYGGEQQKKLRPGTESAPLIAAFATAVGFLNLSQNADHIRELNRCALEKLQALEGVTINSPTDALPYIINISVNGIRSETMLHHLEENGVYVSSSSACAKGKRSYVLEAMGLSDDRIDSSLRISFSRYNTTEDIDALIEGLQSGIATLQRK
ncbi:cysteine desulfurase family protein [Ruminococcus difficilis]|uniref:cysteine desulfurase n=1 Tax=Ruminococcus difficilis TaxID=2763069 RepID=A0A934WSK2_9FIRM|nr:cysteine desulfurase family protein [Ruminococcus difficilis]MBK6089168.1 cysteine desulfurase [Ruminococcus difficilis]